MQPRPRLCCVVDCFVYTQPVHVLQPRFIVLCLLMCCRGCKRSFHPVFVLASGQRALLWWCKNAGHPPLTRQTKILSSAPHRCRPFYTAVLPTFPGHYIIYIIYMPTARLNVQLAYKRGGTGTNWHVNYVDYVASSGGQ